MEFWLAKSRAKLPQRSVLYSARSANRAEHLAGVMGGRLGFPPPARRNGRDDG